MVAGGGGGAGSIKAVDKPKAVTGEWTLPENRLVFSGHYKGGDGGLVGEDGEGPYAGTGGTQASVGKTARYETLDLGLTAVGGQGSNAEGARVAVREIDANSDGVPELQAYISDPGPSDFRGALAAGGGGYFGGGASGGRWPVELFQGRGAPARDPWTQAWADEIMKVHGAGGGGGGSSLATSSKGLPDATVVKGERGGRGMVQISTCVFVPVKSATITKTVGTPVRVSPGVFDVPYTVTATSGATSNVDVGYTVSDRYTFGKRITVVSTTVVPRPGAAPAASSFNGVDQLTMASGTLAPGASHVWDVTVRVNVGAAEPGAAANCSLEPGESGTGLRNVAVLMGSGFEATPAITCATFPGTDKITLDKVADQPSAPVGSTVTYTLTLKNDGDHNVMPTSLDDPLKGLSTLDCPLRKTPYLAPGESLACTATYTVTDADQANGTVVNTATAGANSFSGPLTATDTATVTVPPPAPPAPPLKPLPETGSEISLPIVGGAAALVLLGVGFAAYGMRRRNS